MNIRILFVFILTLACCFSCSTDANDTTTPKVESETETETETEVEATPLPMYFPPIDSDEWETITVADLNWNTDEVQPLLDFLEDNNTEAFIILQNGRIVLENYFGDFDATQNHSWNSAAKTLTSMTVGIAQHEGFLSIDEPSLNYLGEGWSSLTSEQESNITIKHHLTMTTGMDYTVEDNFCSDAACLIYLNEPDTFWYYHNATYSLVDEIIAEAVGQNFQLYFNDKIRNRIGMQGFWLKAGYLNLYQSTPRSMARYGLLNLNEGVWDGSTIFEDQAYFTAAINTSQNLNESYGYLFWLNGKSTHRITASEELFSGKLIPNAPDDLYAGLGAFDQKLYVIPSKDLVIVRMGNAANGASLGPSGFDNTLWQKISDLIK